MKNFNQLFSSFLPEIVGFMNTGKTSKTTDACGLFVASNYYNVDINFENMHLSYDERIKYLSAQNALEKIRDIWSELVLKINKAAGSGRSLVTINLVSRPKEGIENLEVCEKEYKFLVTAFGQLVFGAYCAEHDLKISRSTSWVKVSWYHFESDSDTLKKVIQGHVTNTKFGYNTWVKTVQALWTTVFPSQRDEVATLLEQKAKDGQESVTIATFNHNISRYDRIMKSCGVFHNDYKYVTSLFSMWLHSKFGMEVVHRAVSNFTVFTIKMKLCTKDEISVLLPLYQAQILSSK